MTDAILTGSCYVVLDIPSPMAEKIRELRERFDAVRSAMPAEITVAGSGGTGPAEPGQSVDKVIACLDRAVRDLKPFSARFGAVGQFAGTDIYFLTLQDPEPFQKVHQVVAGCGLRFLPSPYPYFPHCTLKLRQTPSPQEKAELLALPPPPESFTLGILSLYSLSDANNCELLHKVEFGLPV